VSVASGPALPAGRTWTRRDLLKVSAGGGAGLALALWLPPRLLAAEEAAAAQPFAPNVFVAIGTDGTVTITAAKSEMGQGVRTALPMILADELEADWERVRVVQADADPKYGPQGTGGSASVRTGWEPLRRAGAAAREMLIAAAAAGWGVEAASCRAERGEVVHPESGRRAGYGDLTVAAAALPVPEDPPLKKRQDFRLIGSPTGRVDAPDIVRGRAGYGIDVRLPDMLYAVVERSPVFGGKVASFDAAKALKVAGVRGVFPLAAVAGGVFTSNGVAVVADSTWEAIQGRRALTVEWDPGTGGEETSERLYAACRERLAQPAEPIRQEGDATAALAAAERKVSAEYALPFVAHATMEPMNCTAHVTADGCEIWAPTQFPGWAQGAVAQALGLPPEKVKVHVTLLGGGFGRRINPDFVVEAALVAKQAGKPVKVQWTREDDMQHDFYRPLTVHRLEAALGEDGLPTAWLYRVAGTSIRTFLSPGADDPARFELAGLYAFPYRVPNFRLEYLPVESVVPRGWWRSVDSSQNAFVRESFVDEMAAAAGRDPLDLRLAMIGEPRRVPLLGQDDYALETGRLAGVLRLAAEKAGWGKPLPAGRGRGIAAFSDHLSYAAEVAEVSVSDDGEVTVHRVVVAVDCGTVVNPAMVERQMESGVIDGLTVALQAEITVAGGRVEQSNFHDYRLLQIVRAPEIEVHIVDSDVAPTGAGEPGLPPIAPAVANAVFAATGKRVRRLPIPAADLAKA
jgi:isoquinoline 1-oxidoreductase beta subunit